MLPVSIQAGLWGLLSGSSLLLGAWVGYRFNLRQRLVAAIMAFGSGVLISVLSFDLMDEAYAHGGFMPTAVGFIGGALLYTLANKVVNMYGAKNRKRSGGQSDEHTSGGSGAAIAIGALIDAIPESIVIGVSMLQGGNVSRVAVIAIFIANIPEGLSSSAGMKKAGRSRWYVFGVWGAITLISAISALAGYTVFAHFSINIIVATVALAAGAILAMLTETMIPEAFETAHNYTGIITVLGFLCAFILTKVTP